jgi:hypothetical protein
MEEKYLQRTKLITSCFVAKKLLEKGYQIVDLKPNLLNRSRTVFVFELKDNLLNDANILYQKQENNYIAKQHKPHKKPICELVF